jgi:hypothetical protein
MSDYTEHLISMAGGDGDTADQLAEIEARLTGDKDDFGNGYADQTIRDREHLLAIIRTQQAQIERVLDLANTRSRCGWRISADEIRKALTATEGA